jgi:hypothetical protein
MASGSTKDAEPVIAVGGANKKNDAKRIKVLVGVAAAVLVLALGVPHLMGGSGSSSVGSVASEPVAPTKATTTTTSTTAVPVATRDPFGPVAGVVTAAAVAPTVVTAGQTTTTPGSTTAAPSATPPAPAPTTTAPSNAPRPIRVSLLEVDDGPTAVVRVDDTVVSDLAVNDTFLGSYRIVSLDRVAQCGVIIYGDQRVDLCQGDEAVL